MAAILAGLDGEVIAIAFLFAVLVGVMIVRPMLVAALGNAPFIGGWLAANVDSALAAWQRAMAPLAAGSLGALSSTIDWLTWALHSLLATVTGLAQLGYAADWRLLNLALPAAIQQAEAVGSSALAGAESRLNAALVAEAHLAQLATAQVAVTATGLFQAAEADARALATSVAAEAQAGSQAVLQQATDLAAAERSFAVAQILGVEAEIHTAFTQAVNITAAAEAALQGDIKTVSDHLTAGVQSEVDALLKQISADKAALASALTGGLAAVAVDIAAIRALKCIQNCSPLGDLGQFLNGLDAVLLVAAVAEARAHPAEAAAFLKGSLLPFARDAAKGAEGLIGG